MLLDATKQKNGKNGQCKTKPTNNTPKYANKDNFSFSNTVCQSKCHGSF